jgi:transcriptional regulator with XRE-family HTH domain
MSDDDARYGATVAKRRLARRLAALRARAGMSVNEASDKLGWKRGRLNRFEANLWRQPDPSHIRDLARIYGATDAERAELEELVVLARSRMWWHELDRGAEKVFDNEFPGFENDAARISVYMPLVLPGLLQTPAYTRALLSVGPCSAGWRERAMAARQRRQQILDRADGTAPRLVAVITEAALMYQWGDAADRREQAARLAELGRRPGVEMRLLGFRGGPHPGMSSLINIFEFPDEADPSIVYLENDTTIHEVTRPDEVAAYQETFARIRRAALPASDTKAYLQQLAGAREQAGSRPGELREASG